MLPSGEHLVGTKFGVLKCGSVRRKPPGEQWSRRETVEARGAKWNFDVGAETGTHEQPGPLLESTVQRGDSNGASHLHIPHNLAVTCLKFVDKECTRKRSGVELSGLTSAELLDARHVRRPVGGSSHSRECKSYQDAWDESRRTASAEEAKRGIVGDPDTRPLDPSGSSLDPEPKRTKTTSVTDNDPNRQQRFEKCVSREYSIDNVLEKMQYCLVTRVHTTNHSCHSTSTSWRSEAPIILPTPVGPSQHPQSPVPVRGEAGGWLTDAQKST